MSTELNEEKITDLSLKIIDLLVGVPLGQAHHVLENTKALLLDFHSVDPRSARFIEKQQEFAGYARGYH